MNNKQENITVDLGIANLIQLSFISFEKSIVSISKQLL